MPNIKIGPSEQQEVVRLYSNGMTATAIAKQMHVEVDTVTRALRRAGVSIHRGPRRRITAQDAQAMVIRYDAGENTVQIAIAFDCDAGTVQRHLKENGVTLRPAGFQQGEGHHNWKGGRIVTDSGYALVLIRPDDFYYPMAQIKTTNARYCLEHRLVMAKHLGRLLRDDETVHHKDDRDRQNNDISNLQLRQGKHGKGAVFRCKSCGSHDVEPIELASHVEH
jgi:HNH endonuclease